MFKLCPSLFGFSHHLVRYPLLLIDVGLEPCVARPRLPACVLPAFEQDAKITMSDCAAGVNPTNHPF